MTQEALKLALEALENAEYGDYDKEELNQAITAIKEALAQTQEPVAHWSDCAVHSEPAYPKGECDCGGIVAVADYTALSDKYVALSDKYVALKAQRAEQEPVAMWDGKYQIEFGNLSAYKHGEHSWIPLYTTPPQRTWVELTDETISEIAINNPPMVHEFARAIEAKLKEKNT